MKVKVAVINAFVDGGVGGNPAGVVLESDLLTDKQKLEIARKIGLSETAFVSASRVADFKLDFFTPERQIAHCGHATIATFSYLSQLGLVPDSHTSKETIDGTRKIEIRGEFAYMEQLAPTYRELGADVSRVLTAVGVSAGEVIAQPIVANTGNSFILLGVKDRVTLNALKPDLKLISEISDAYDLIGFYVFTLETTKEGRDASTRMFAPRYGIQEESATGMAAGPLACFLHDYMSMNKNQFTIEQGYAMKPASPSCIDVSLTVSGGSILSLVAGGVGAVSRFDTVEI